MNKLSSIILLLVSMISMHIHSQKVISSPHGSGFTMDCARCHSPESWTFNNDQTSFNHDSTSFPLTGKHMGLDCKSCHASLKFEKTPSDCASCHIDIHEETVGIDCARCHTSPFWAMDNISEMHERISFPLIGGHTNVDCNQCHISETNLRFDPIEFECISCHKEEFNSTISPDHNKNGYSEDCTQCHTFSPGWTPAVFKDHNSFYPLEGVHARLSCNSCHINENYTNTPNTCFGCHSADYTNTKNPNHKASNFPIDCINCHNQNAWMPAVWDHDASYFPIYRGHHKGVWDQCTDCHTNSTNYAEFTCTTCHKQNSTNNEHDEVSNYLYESNACFKCHPNG